MTFTRVGGGDGPDGQHWIGLLVIGILILSPVVLGLVLRVLDRRRQPVDPAPAARVRRGFTVRSVLAIAVALLVAFVLSVAGLEIVGLPLGLLCVAATMSRDRFSPRL